jgi:hypothetical protein
MDMIQSKIAAIWELGGGIFEPRETCPHGAQPAIFPR